jgi:hypothetical protein
LIGIYYNDGIDLPERFFCKSARKVFQVDRESVGYIKFIFEAYDGLAILTTIDPLVAIVEVKISPGSENDVEEILEDLNRYLPIRILNE